MARRKRSTRFAGSPAEHDTKAEKAYYQARDYYWQATSAATEDNCVSAVSELQKAAKAMGRAEAHFSESNRVDAARKAQQKAIKAMRPAISDFSRACKLEDREKRWNVRSYPNEDD